MLVISLQTGDNSSPAMLAVFVTLFHSQVELAGTISQPNKILTFLYNFAVTSCSWKDIIQHVICYEGVGGRGACVCVCVMGYL